MAENNQQLEQRVQALEKWQKDRDRQQIVYPLDSASQIILNNYFVAISGILTYLGASGNEVPNLMLTQNNKTYVVQPAFPPFFKFTAATSDILTVGTDLTNTYQGSFQDNDQVSVYSTETLPNPLSSAVTYYVISSTGNTFKLTTVMGSIPDIVNITDTGTGTHLIQTF